MANNWKDGSDNWNTPADWSSGTVPGSSDSVTVAQGDPQVANNVGTIASLTVSAELDFQSNSSLDVSGTATNSGTIDVAANNYYGGASFTVGGLLTSYGTLNIGNSGETVAVTTTVGSLQNYSGSTTGTINLTGGASNGHTYATALNVQSAAGFGGTTTGSEIGNVNLSGDAQINFASGQIGTIRGTLNLDGVDAVVSSDGMLRNSALDGLTSVTGQLNLFDGSVVTTTNGVTNTGTIGVDPYNYSGGSTLTIGGALTNPGTLNIGNTGGGSTTAATVGVKGLQNYNGSTLGTINLNGGTLNTSTGSTYEALLKIGGAAGFGIAGREIGTVNLYQDAQIQFLSGQINTVAGSLTLTSADAAISNDGTDTNSALTGLTTVSGTLNVYDHVTIDPTGNVANSGTLGVDSGNYAGGSVFAVKGSVTNSGTLNVGNSGMGANTTVSASSLANLVGSTDGTINVSGGPVNSSTGIGNEALLSIAGSAGFGTTGQLIGSVNLSQDAQIDFTSGQINTITSGSELTLVGPNAVIANDGSGTNSALTGLTTIAGRLSIFAGSTVAPTGNLTNTGTLEVDPYNYGGGSSLAVTGSLTNSGTINFGNTGLSTSTSLSAASLTNFVGSTNGTINVTGNVPNPQTGIADVATLTVGGPAGFGTAGTITGNVNLDQDAQIQFASGQITTIATGSELSLNGANAAIANDGSDTNSALTGLTTVAGNLYLYNDAALATGAASASAGALTIGNLLTDTAYIQTPSLDIAAQGTLDIGAGGSVSSPITFAGTNSGEATLALDATPYSGSTFGNTLTNFGDNDALDLKGLAFAPGATATYANGTLTITSNGVIENFTLSNPGATTFYAHQDSGTGTLVTDSPTVCFASGTRIRTERGDIAVEDLVVGDHEVLATGGLRPIRWIGHRVLRPAERRVPSDVWPVRVLAGAFGPGLPARDLMLSPGHPVLVGADVDNEGGHLVPIMCLINGTSIARVKVDEVTYWHVELDAHDVLLAEGLPAESYLDWGDRAFFTEGVDHALANPDLVVPGLAARCRPVALDGAVVEAERQRLDMLFATRLAGAAAWPSMEATELWM